jgi:hypothetical protein
MSKSKVAEGQQRNMFYLTCAPLAKESQDLGGPLTLSIFHSASSPFSSLPPYILTVSSMHADLTGNSAVTATHPAFIFLASDTNQCISAACYLSVTRPQ